jgi:hypothetical protein
MKSLPGFTVTTTEHQIDGHRAVHLAIATSKSVTCPGGHIQEFRPNDPTVTAGWFITPGDPDSVWIVEIPGHTVLLQYLGASVTATDEENLFSTIKFLDKLPTS